MYNSQKELKHFDLEILVVNGILYNKSSCIIFCAKLFSIFSNTYFETFYSKKIRQEKIWKISSLYGLNCFKYFLINILRENASKIRQEKF